MLIFEVIVCNEKKLLMEAINLISKFKNSRIISKKFLIFKYTFNSFFYLALFGLFEKLKNFIKLGEVFILSN